MSHCIQPFNIVMCWFTQIHYKDEVASDYGSCNWLKAIGY
jgi:hypothetical protein